MGGVGREIIFFIGLESRSIFVLKYHLQGCLEAKNVYN